MAGLVADPQLIPSDRDAMVRAFLSGLDSGGDLEELERATR